ncbi:hypothetical protein K1T71_008274 [Dendrolimus kikuchii]|uniref:Uncharacterized protein n=1 Tax=Dendrolimus kikuchii TaxID=765133 RepID=A0ACC1CWS9_9NEOP|nr:hypothetical protein K1T71_008274 [Dendrolimus kikuchii]
MDNICRLCLSHTSVNNDIFNEETELYIKITLYLPIKVLKHDRLPQKICDLCSSKVNDLYLFSKTAIEVQDRLQFELMEFTNSQETDTSCIIDKTTQPLPQNETDKNLNQNLEEINDAVTIKEAGEFAPNQIIYIKNEFSEIDHIIGDNKLNEQNKNCLGKRDNAVEINNLKELLMSELGGETNIPSLETEGKECEKETLICGFPPPDVISVRKTSIAQKDDKDKKQHECVICKKTFQKWTNLVRHQKIHNTSRQFECRECGKRFSHYYRLEWHKEIVHSGKKPYVCATCTKGFSTRSNLTRHEKIHTGIRPFACDICKKTFVDGYKLQCHKKVVHSGVKKFACSRCDRAFGQRGHLVEHEKSHYKIRPFNCSKCDKAFSMRSNLKRHLKTHADSKRYFCSFCKMSYKKHSQLMVHERSHTGEKPFECDLCGVTTASKSEIKVHIWQHMDHDSQLCETCGKAFMSSSELRIHKLLHAEEKPFSCTICKKSFNKKSNLNRHERIHNADDRPFKCLKCDKGFKDRSNLNRHLRFIHNHQRIFHYLTKPDKTSDYIKIIDDETIKMEPADL